VERKRENKGIKEIVLFQRESQRVRERERETQGEVELERGGKREGGHE